MALKTLEQRRAEKQAVKAARAQSPNCKAAIKAKAIKAGKIHNVRAGMVGMTIEWSDSNPLGSDGNSPVKATNKNPLQFNCAQEMWDDLKCRAWIVKEVFTWEVVVVMVFKLLRPRPDKTHREDIIEIRQTGRLRDPFEIEETPINQEIERQIMAELMANAARPDSDKNKGEFVVANYKIVCVGH